jgi:hypothetical protein
MRFKYLTWTNKLVTNDLFDIEKSDHHSFNPPILTYASFSVFENLDIFPSEILTVLFSVYWFQ